MTEFFLGSIVRAREICSEYKKFRLEVENQMKSEDGSIQKWNSQNHLRIQLFEANAKIALLKAIVEFFMKQNQDATTSLIIGLIEEIPASSLLLDDLLDQKQKVESLLSHLKIYNQMSLEERKK